MDAKRIFDQIAAKSHERPLVLFDLDSTLYNVSGRTALIMKHFAEEAGFKRRFPRESEALKTLEFLPSDWGLREAFERAKLESTIDFFTAVRDYWRKHFFSSRFLHADVPYEGAVDYVNGLEMAGADIRYLTGRDAPNMRLGTIESLGRWGFPVSQIETRLMMKPIKGSQEDEDFKAQRIEALMPESGAVWFFENEPVIINEVLERHPNVQVVFIDTTHSRRATAPSHLPKISGRYRR